MVSEFKSRLRWTNFAGNGNDFHFTFSLSFFFLIASTTMSIFQSFHNQQLNGSCNEIEMMIFFFRDLLPMFARARTKWEN